MKNIKKILAILLAVLMVASLSTAVFADGEGGEGGGTTGPAAAGSGTPYTAVTATSTTFQKALILDENANVPTVQFTYSIASGTAVPAASGVMEIISPSADTGVTGTPSIAAISYAPGDSTVTTAEGVTIDAGEKAALKTVTVDFSGVSFAEPGVYRYLVTETSADQQGMYYDTQPESASGTAGFTSKQRVLDVYVVDNAGILEIQSYVLHELVENIAAGENGGSSFSNLSSGAVADKSLGFVNEYKTYDLTVGKTVSGNQASKDKYFAFEIAITNAGANVDLDVDWTGASAALNPSKSVATTYAAATMNTANNADDNLNIEGQQWVTDANGAVTKTVYLLHGQTIVIKGLAEGAKYTITETPEDYTAANTKTPAGGTAVQGTNVASETVGMAADHVVAFVNTRAGTIPTGVMLTVVPGIVIVMLAMGGLFLISRKRRNET